METTIMVHSTTESIQEYMRDVMLGKALKAGPMVGRQGYG